MLQKYSKIAYKTLQQSKSIAGFAHKQISSRLMNLILPDSKLENFSIDKYAEEYADKGELTNKSYDELAKEYQFKSQKDIDGKPKDSSLIGGLIRALLWGD